MSTKPTGRKTSTRTSLASIGDDGSRVAIHPSDVRGRFMSARRLSAVLLVAVYVLLPWIPVKGKPAVFLDVANLRFHFFGLTFAAQDLWLAFFLITGLGFTLFFVTALFGRLWCGWACPQTIFLEHVYRRIELWIEGDAATRRRLDAGEWTAEKTWKRGAKHVASILVSLVIAHVLLAYFVSIPEVLRMVTHSPGEHWGVFLFIVVATTMLYLNFVWFREQLCIILCPYGRLQSALIDDNSVVIGYDAGRGEPRGALRSSGGDGAGDCIDCFRCVQVCPTGIDIREGLQLECIACSACIDACDQVMDRVGKPRGLIRYDSMNGLAGGKTRFFRPRVVLYSVLLLVGAVVATLSVSRYESASLSVVRMQGAPYYVDDATVRNQFLVRVVNKQDVDDSFDVRVSVPGEAAIGVTVAGWDEPLKVSGGEESVRPLVVSVPRASYDGKFPLKIELIGTGRELTLARETEFVGPDPRLLKEHVSDDR
jgi:cytochrome c oxidase accessory protein FixG